MRKRWWFLIVGIGFGVILGLTYLSGGGVRAKTMTGQRVEIGVGDATKAVKKAEAPQLAKRSIDPKI